MAEPNYYAVLLRQLPRLLVDAAGRVTAIAFVVASAIGGFASSKVVNALIAPGWWALIAVAGVLLVAVLRANHRYVIDLQGRATGMKPTTTPVIYQYHQHGPVHGNVYVGPPPGQTSGVPPGVTFEATADDPQQELPLNEGSQ